MDEATRTGGPAVEHKRGPAEIREDIAQTREELGETVEALSAKTDVKAQARAKVDETKEQLHTKIGAVKQRVGATSDGTASSAPDPARQGVQKLKALAADNPRAMAMIGVFVAGVVVGRLLRRR